MRQHERLELIGEATSGRQALELIRRLTPHVAVIARDMGDLDAGQMLHELANEKPAVRTRVLIIARAIDSHDAFAMIEDGAAGLFLKTAGAEELADAVAAVAHSDTVLPHELHAGLMEQIRGRSSTERVSLTSRELQMLGYLAQGLSAPLIGSLCHLSASTVKTYLHQLYMKLGVSDRAAAVAVGIRRGLID